MPEQLKIWSNLGERVSEERILQIGDTWTKDNRYFQFLGSSYNGTKTARREHRAAKDVLTETPFDHSINLNHNKLFSLPLLSSLLSSSSGIVPARGKSITESFPSRLN